MSKELNVVYIGSPTFPNGFAMTKRWRYMVVYMNEKGIQSHVLVCHHKIDGTFSNPEHGKYGLAEYRDIRKLFVQKKWLSFYREGKQCLKDWYAKDKNNILIFTTTLSLLLLPFFKYARSMGYKIVFDQVETNMLLGGKMRLRRKLNLIVSNWITKYAHKQSDSFVISSALWRQNHEKYPNMRLCLLPNATVDLQKSPKNSLHCPLKVVYSGTFGEKDGVNFLIDGAIEAKARGCDLELIMSGKGQPWNMKVLDKLNGCTWAKYLGFLSDEDMLSLIQNGDVLCMTRNNSTFANFGFPFKLSEYLSTGNILLATRVGDVEKYVTNKKDAFVIDPESAHQIADALCYIASHKDEAIEIAQRGHETMKREFSIENVGKIFVNFLSSL